MLFENYQIQSKNNNEIPFHANIPNLLRALKSGDSADQIVLKLTKKGDRPFLSFEMVSRAISVTQDVPIALQGAQKVLVSYLYRWYELRNCCIYH